MSTLGFIVEVDDMARLDVFRANRKGVPEIILAEGKDHATTLKLALKAVESSGIAIISRVGRKHIGLLRRIKNPTLRIEIFEKARIAIFKKKGYVGPSHGGKIGILAAGTSDIPIAEEARVIAEEMGCETTTAYDVGVAGIHRLFPPLKKMLEEDVDAFVVVAGREGALASVVAGLVPRPVIGVPTSQGYGYGGRGKSALAAMLQACSLGMAVVNIDAGVPAGAMAGLIANRCALKRTLMGKGKSRAVR